MNIRRKYIVMALAAFVIVGLLPMVIPTASACNCETKTPGFWKNHPDAWPVESIIIGGVSYSKESAIIIMQTPGKGDKTYTMFNALVAAKLNLINGCNGCIRSVVADANSWMSTNEVGEEVGGSSDAWQQGGEMLYKKLDAYNNGYGCS